MGKIKNYTSEVPAINSINKIEQMLVDVGAKNVNKQYDENKRLLAVNFLVDINGNTSAFKLPAKVEVVKKVLWEDVKRPTPQTRERIERQAERTAWKIVRDWVEIQCAMIKLEQAELAEVFLPYYYDPAKDETLWQRIKEGDLKLLQ